MMWKKRLSACLLILTLFLFCCPMALAAEGDPSDPSPQPPVSEDAGEETEPEQPEEDETPDQPGADDPQGEPEQDEKPFPNLCEQVGDLLETEIHNAYISGYKGGNFRPEGKITRAETAQLFYSLLKEKPEITAGFDDVPDIGWYSTQVRTMASLGAISGYPDGSFRPNRNITRAEFVSIASRFSAFLEGEMSFSDMGEASWAERAVSTAVAHGWVAGYENGTFRPNNFISRAEAVVILNAMLERRADADAVLIHRTVEFEDVARTYWAYPAISEAATDHDYTKTAGGEIWNFDDRYDGTAWVTLEDGGITYQPEGEPLTGFQHILNYTYYFDPETGVLQTGWKVIDGKHYLLPEKGQESHPLQMNEKLTKVNYNTGNRGFREIDYITVHYTADIGASAHEECLSFEDRYRGASAHFFVDETGVWRCVQDRDISWHCGSDVYYHDSCRNTTSVGIEMCCYKRSTYTTSAYDSDWYFAEKTVENTAALVREMMMRYGVPLENVVRHNDVSHKVCPAPYVNSFSAWQAFLKKVGENKVNYDGSYEARVTQPTVTVYSGPGFTYSSVATLKKDDIVTVYEERGQDPVGSGRWVRIQNGWIIYAYISRK